MARVGRFGNLPGRAPDLTNTIVALMEQYESARDRNILSAWMNGGKFEGSKVTDQRIRNWFKMRRSQYGKDDPEYDYWDQQLSQIDYQIGESKMLLAFEQGKIKEGGAAAWYMSNAKRFPKNSEAWREAMRNAARFKKAAQEKARAARTVSNSEKYQNEINQIERRSIRPAEAAMRILDRAVRKHGLQPVRGAGFMNLDTTGLMGDETLRDFMRSEQGRKFADLWENATGERFSYKALRGIINDARRGAEKAAQVARKYGYESYVPSWESQARQWGEVNTQLNVFSSDIYDRYTVKAGTFYKNYPLETTAEGRQERRDAYAAYLEREIKKADRTGDDVLAGALRNELRAIRGEDPIANANPLAFSGGSSGEGVAQTLFEIQYDEKGAPKYVGLQEPSVEESQRADALRDADIIASHKAKDGVWGYMIDVDTGERIDVNIEEARGTSRTNRDAGYITNYENGVPVLITLQQMEYVDPGTGQQVPYQGAFTYTDINGVVRFQYPGPTGEMIDTTQPPFDVDLWDDPDGRSGPGEIWDGRQSVPIWEMNGNVLTFSKPYIDNVLVPAAETAAGGTADTAKVNAALSGAAQANLASFSPTAPESTTAEELPEGVTAPEPAEGQTQQVSAVDEKGQLAEVPIDGQALRDTLLGNEEKGIQPSPMGGQIMALLLDEGLLDENNVPVAGVTNQQVYDLITENYDEGTANRLLGAPEQSVLVPEGSTETIGSQVTERGAITVTLEQPWVINDTGSTTDLSGVLTQYYSVQGRKELAAMPPEQRITIMQIAAEANGLDFNDPYVARTIAEEVDVLVAAGDTGEWEYISAFGAASPENRDDAIGYNLIYRNIVDANSAPGVSMVTYIPGLDGSAFAGALKEAGWSDEQIRAEGYGEDLDAYNANQADMFGGGPSLYDNEPVVSGQTFDPYAAIDGGRSDVGGVLSAGEVEPVVPGERRGAQLELRAAIAGVIAGSTVPPDPALAQSRQRGVGNFSGSSVLNPAIATQAATVSPKKMTTKSIKAPTYDPLGNIPRIEPANNVPIQQDGGFKLPWEPGGFFNQNPTKPADVGQNAPTAPKYDPLSSAYTAPKAAAPVSSKPTTYTWDGPSGYEEQGNYSWED